MADYESVMNDLTTQLNTTLATLSPVPDLVLEGSIAPNTSRDPRAGEYVQVRSRPIAADLSELDSPVSLNTDRIVFGIFTPLGKGTGRAREIADALVVAFQGKSIGDASCYEAIFRTVGRDSESQFYHSEVSVLIRWEHAAA